MLDYAANAVLYWPIHRLQALFEQTQREMGRDPRQLVAELCGDETVTVEAFFTKVADNPRAGKIRMIFVADEIPDDLRRIVEFLNEQMNPAEVFAVEIKQSPRIACGRCSPRWCTGVRRPRRPSRLSGGKSARASQPGGSGRAPAVGAAERWAAEQGRALQESSSGVITLSRTGPRVVQLYPKDKALCFNLEPLRKRGNGELADSCLAML